jgi:hypothetical protein
MDRTPPAGEYRPCTILSRTAASCLKKISVLELTRFPAFFELPEMKIVMELQPRIG